MRRLFLELYHKQIFPSTPITNFSPFLSYIVVTPLMLGFEKDFSCHSHLGPIRILLLFPFPPAPFPQNEKEDGTLELYYISAYCLQKILLLQLGGHRRSRMDRLNILLGSLVLTLLCGIHSRLALGITSSCAHKIQLLYLLHCHQPFLVPLLEQKGFMFFHRLVIPLHSYLFFQFRSRLVYKIEWPILLWTLDSIVFQEC
ncbi:hypothetical protein F8388_008086 [Cannabis sativa]|uniref:Uncharacterized protein n=1 Tax=Cannabis sativa TaxID=3483 RepID=A0A7J6ECD4_CANSA|nr:hypothetical protein F8388_008086 [Cannabis sativa]